MGVQTWFDPHQWAYNISEPKKWAGPIGPGDQQSPTNKSSSIKRPHAVRFCRSSKVETSSTCIHPRLHHHRWIERWQHADWLIQHAYVYFLTKNFHERTRQNRSAPCMSLSHPKSIFHLSDWDLKSYFSAQDFINWIVSYQLVGNGVIWLQMARASTTFYQHETTDIG